MNKSSYLLILASTLSFCAAIFQAAIGFVPKWSAAFGAGDTLVSKPALLLISALLVALLLVIFGLYGLSGAGVIRRLPLLRLGLLVIGVLYSLVGIYFIPQILTVLGILPSAQPVPIYLLLISFGAMVACLAYLIGLVVSWKRLSIKTPSINTDKTITSSQETKSLENQSGNGDEFDEDQTADITATWNLLNPP
jgi:putative oxidoreductase